MGVARDKRKRKAVAEVKARQAEAGSNDDPVVAVWFRTRSGDMIQFDLTSGEDVDRVMALMIPIARPVPFKWSQIFDFLIDGLTFLWLFRLIWAFIGVLLFTFLNVLGWFFFVIFRGAVGVPNLFLRGMRRLIISLKWVFWRRFVSVKIGKKWARTVASNAKRSKAA